MRSFYSIIRFVNNPLSKENLAIGLIMISDNKIYYKFSNEKIQLVNKINPVNFKLLEYTIEKIKSFIQDELKKEVSLFSEDNKVNFEYLKRLSIYNNGFLQFDNPSIVNMGFDEIRFDVFFQKYIDLVYKPVPKIIVDKTFEKRINQLFRDPLANLIDIDYKVKKGDIPNLFFDYKLDGIGVNGVVYSVKTIDLNAEKPIDSIRKDISELESLNYRIDLFSKSRGIEAKNNNHYLVIDNYNGVKSSYRELYEILSSQKKEDYPYEIIKSDDLSRITKEIQNSKAGKFSELIKS
jgi:hypothetical protein